jgi:tight adherence protein C
MDPLLTLGAAAVAAGVGAATVGTARAMAAHGTSEQAIDFLRDDGVLASSEFSAPFFVRLAGPAWARFERFARACTPSWWLGRLRHKTTLAGLGRWGVEGVLAMKGAGALAGALAMPALVAAMGAKLGTALIWSVLGGAFGFLGPDVWVSRRARSRQMEIRRTLPEALDLMAIGVQAGMGLEATIALVTQRLPGALGEELNRMLHEVQLGASRREALHNLRERTDVDELSTFALALAQADTLGSPLGEVLRVQAGEMRMLRRQRAREQAAKTPVKLLVPLLVGIFPALGIVVVGPAVLSIMRAFGH